MKKKLILAAATMMLLFAACKKDDDATIVAKWSINNTSLNNVVNGVSTVSTYTGIPADYVDFRTDNKVYTSVNGALDTNNYSVNNNQVTIIKNTPGATASVYDIKSLSNTAAQLYTKNTASVNNYSELTINLKR